MLSSLYDSIISIKVGPENTTFGIHRGLLCHHSSYFDRALNGGFKEAVEGEVILADEDPTIFTRFNEWLYTGAILLGKIETERDIPYPVLVKLYIFAEKRGVVRLQNRVTDFIIRKNKISQSFPNSCIRFAWTNTADSSPLHRLLVDLYVRQANFAEIMDNKKSRNFFNKDILTAFVLAFHRLRDERSARSRHNLCDISAIDHQDYFRQRCEYHVHNKDHPPDCWF